MNRNVLRDYNLEVFKGKIRVYEIFLMEVSIDIDVYIQCFFGCQCFYIGFINLQSFVQVLNGFCLSVYFEVFNFIGYIDKRE